MKASEELIKDFIGRLKKLECYEEFLDNFGRRGISIEEWVQASNFTTRTSFSDMLAGAFMWWCTEQGDGYWREIADKIDGVTALKTKREIAEEQIHLQEEMQSKGFNIVTCGHCGTVLLHRTGEETIQCFCGEMALSDCPDLWYEGAQNDAEFYV